MKRASVREVQHNLAGILEVVASGQEIAITRRGRIVARIVPARERPVGLEWPDSAARMKRLGRAAVRGAPASRVIREARTERI